MKKIFILITISLCALFAEAQQDVMLSQYMFNPLLINPAYAGSKDYMQATLLYRKQWAGWGDGAPESEAASLHGPLANKNFGLGGSLTNDHIGVTTRTSFYADFAYQMQLNRQMKLGLGIQGGFSNYSFNYTNSYFQDHVWDQTDPIFNSAKKNNFLPNFGVGAFLYAEKFYVGLSVPHLLDYDSTKAINIASSNLFSETRHYFATAGYVIDANPDVIFKPSILVKYVPHAPVEADFNLNVMFVSTFWLGVSYRTNDAIVGILEIQLTRKLRLGYAYDYTTTDINNYSNGSHEVMLGYDFGYDIMKMKTPRYF